jgi:hypothetical protein
MKTLCRLPRSKTSVPDLDELRRQLDGWRNSQTGRARLPAEVWELAAALARTHGVSRVSRTLRLSFHKLQRCLQAWVSPPGCAPAPAEFIELPPMTRPAPGEGGWVVELCDGDQARMTVRFSGASPVVLGLAEAFWRRNR